MKPIIITAGEPAGIGPDIILQLAGKEVQRIFHVVADQQLFIERARLLQISVPANIIFYQVDLNTACKPGILNTANAGYVLECLNKATEYCLKKEFHALVTGPVHKGVINQAGFSFSGHTEYLAELTHSPMPVMLFSAGKLRLALLTTHIPLAAVPRSITAEKIQQVIAVIDEGMKKRFRLPKPKIAVCGLNPHAGEGGYLGREEIDIITPTLQSLRAKGYALLGPIPADTAFTPDSLSQCDIVLAMYHDQGLPVIKAQNFSSAVNVTLGLPIIRTSVDHGTALALAGTGKANYANLNAAMQLAEQLC